MNNASFNHSQQSRHLLLQTHTAHQGFTLLEMLVVISLLSLIAGAAIIGYEDVQDQGRYEAAQYEMAEIRNALLQFRRDSGTNDFPGQGIYACTNAINFPSEAGTGSARLDWCNHPANFWMLFINPLDDPSTSSVEEGAWNIDTKRGWNGPYLQRKSGYVDVSDGFAASGAETSSSTVESDLWGIASPFIYKATDTNLVWRTTIGGDPLNKQGTPYLLFDLVDDGSDPTSSDPARLVSLGKDNKYDGGNNSDCLPSSNNENGFPIDHILCLLR